MKYKDRLNIWLENYIKPTAKRRTYESYSLIASSTLKPGSATRSSPKYSGTRARRLHSTATPTQ